MLVDFTALRNPCYIRTADRPGPHNLLLDPNCAVDLATSAAGPARPLWRSIRRGPHRPMRSVTDTTFTLAMDGVVSTGHGTARLERICDRRTASRTSPSSGAQISARNVVVISTMYVPSPVDARSPTPITVGTGTAVVHRNGTSDSRHVVAGHGLRPVRVRLDSDRPADTAQHRHDLHRTRRAG